MLLQYIMWSCIAHTNEQLNPQCSYNQHTTASTSHTRPIPHSPHLGWVGLLLIFRPGEGRRLSWAEHTVGFQLAQGWLQLDQNEWVSNPWPLRYESHTLLLNHCAEWIHSVILCWWRKCDKTAYLVGVFDFARVWSNVRHNDWSLGDLIHVL